MDDWTRHTLEIMGGAAAIGAGAIQLWPKIRQALENAREKKDRLQVLRNARIFRYLHILMDEWLAHKGAQRVLLLHARNRGKPWPPEGPLFISCLDQVVSHNEEQTWDRWQDWRADPSYRRLMHDVVAAQSADGSALRFTATMESGALQDAYRAQGTVASVVFGVRWVEPSALIYFSINFGRKGLGEMTPQELMEPEVQQEIRGYEQRARELHEDRHRVRGLVAASRAAWRIE